MKSSPLQVLITKLWSATNVETQQYRKASKALLVLIPLLGVTYVLVLTGPTEGQVANAFSYARAVLLSSQVMRPGKSISRYENFASLGGKKIQKESGSSRNVTSIFDQTWIYCSRILFDHCLIPFLFCSSERLMRVDDFKTILFTFVRF